MGTSLAVQWLRLCTYTTESPGSNPSQVTKIPHVWSKSQRKKEKKMSQCVFWALRARRMVMEFQFARLRLSGYCLHNNVNVLNTTELHH